MSVACEGYIGVGDRAKEIRPGHWGRGSKQAHTSEAIPELKMHNSDENMC